MLRKSSGTPTDSQHNLSDDDFDPVSTHSYGLSSKTSGGGGGACGGTASSSSKNEEDRHRRTIIIEKKNQSYGFTLQSYGIHYKREQELEMLTYVDQVEYDGPAYKAGMREGDVILSINGVDMEKADHSALVAFIKECDTRMRMVVLFEDCVRKVSLHMRYLHLQNLLQNKVTELEALLQREREILEGKWKTHSLPARKKASSQSVDTGLGCHDHSAAAASDNYTDDIYPSAGAHTGSDHSRRVLASKTNTLPITRTAVSTENIGKLGGTTMAGGGGMENFTPNAQVLLSYQYMDPTSRSNLKSSNSSGIDSMDCLHRDGAAGSNEGLNYYSLKSNASNKSDPNLNLQPRSNCSTLSKRDAENPHQSRHAQYYSNLQENQERPPPPSSAKEHNKAGSSGRCRQSYYCNPCMGRANKKDQQNGGGDNVSLDAYDLAGSPSMCCDPHQCVPIRRRRSKHHHHHHQQQQATPGDPRHNHYSKENINAQQETTHKCHHHHQQQKHQKHKHGTGTKCDEERPQRPKSQSNLPSNPAVALLQYQKQTRYCELTAADRGASRCSLHSCSHNDCCPSTTGSYCTSLSADTLNEWQDQAQEMTATPNHSGKNVRMIVHGQGAGNAQYIAQPQQFQGPHSQLVTRFYHHTVQIQPTPDYQYQQNFIQKQKSWDNLSAKAGVGGYGYEYVSGPGGVGLVSSSVKAAGYPQQQQPSTQPIEPHALCGYRVHPQQHHSATTTTTTTRKPIYQHYGIGKGGTGGSDTPYLSSMPCQHVHAQKQTTTSTTIITSSTSTHNNAKPMESNSNGGGLMMNSKCAASGCQGQVVQSGSSCQASVPKK